MCLLDLFLGYGKFSLRQTESAMFSVIYNQVTRVGLP